MEMKDNPARSAAALPLSGGVTGEGSFTTSSSSSSSSNGTLSPTNILRHAHAVHKRNRALGIMQSNFPRARRVSRLDPSNGTNLVAPRATVVTGEEKTRNVKFYLTENTSTMPETPRNAESSINPPSVSGTMIDADGQHISDKLFQKGDDVRNQQASLDGSVLPMAGHEICMDGDFKHDQLCSVRKADATTQKVAENGVYRKPQDFKIGEVIQIEMKADNVNLAEQRIQDAEDEQRGEPITRCSAHSSVTSTSMRSGQTIQSAAAPQASHVAKSIDVLSSAAQPLSSIADHVSHSQQGVPRNDCNWNVSSQMNPNACEIEMRESSKGGSVLSTVAGLPSEGPSTNKITEAPHANKADKERRKKNYDPDVFFKVNGKHYQKLGKIGSGGSSEVYKVISADCTIYALKKIKLKGRDYPTAYGFCQEIEYLNKLRGKSNIIQLIDYEVTDKSLLQGGTLAVKNGKIKADHFIYMVLEYGEIDLAHMLAQQFKETNDLGSKIDENWLRFYWQQMLEAVNTIHEERIVHSDLKPANFLLVKGSLKLIDFGIAKAILNDTTNIQRDAQVGTLNYMSPEAFLLNEPDENGTVIKCGRPSDIWSLGCILFQMVYGKTPFAGYKTFWAKFKVVTDRNHEIVYEPLPNPLLIDLMRKCLAWDRNDRWRIPQLLQHPFLVPHLSPDLSTSPTHPCSLLFTRVRLHLNSPEFSRLCAELDEAVNRFEKQQQISNG